MIASCVPPTGDLAYNPGLCPDWESNHQPFGSQAMTQSTEPHQPGSMYLLNTRATQEETNDYTHCTERISGAQFLNMLIGSWIYEPTLSHLLLLTT